MAGQKDQDERKRPEGHVSAIQSLCHLASGIPADRTPGEVVPQAATGRTQMRSWPEWIKANHKANRTGRSAGSFAHER